ncbi:hypothetical protein [Pedobacter sp. SYSU D00535]|uniref:hypothetical protein n=1 Tax=Pedobacter sp. SYSU D00535 TaxID=2810308 RepID=UPI001A97A990|nr:hypothetical protein [Pedobacter sp. SYSU D00535]
MGIERLTYRGVLPPYFFRIGQVPYQDLPFCPFEEPELTAAIFQFETRRNETLLYSDGEQLRLVGIFPENSPEAYFGFWETVNNFKLNQTAFSYLEDDAIKRGRSVIKGPINFNTFHNYRLRIGIDPSWISFDREPVNPDYYPIFLQQLGYKAATLFESRFVKKKDVEQFYTDKRKFLKEVKDLPFEMIPITPDSWTEYQTAIYEFVEASFGQNPAFKRVSEEQFRLLYNPGFAKLLCPYSSVIFKERGAKVLAALSFCQPNYSSLKIPYSQLDFRLHFELLKQKTLLIKTVGVHPEYRNRNLMSYLGAYAMLSFREHYEDAIFCLMRSDNVSRNFSRGLQYESTQYALFQKRLK